MAARLICHGEVWHLATLTGTVLKGPVSALLFSKRSPLHGAGWSGTKRSTAARRTGCEWLHVDLDGHLKIQLDLALDALAGCPSGKSEKVSRNVLDAPVVRGESMDPSGRDELEFPGSGFAAVKMFLKVAALYPLKQSG